MPIKVLGVCAGLLGLAMIVFAVMTWRELRTAATSELASTADSMPLTRFVYPELFDAGNAGAKPAKPAELAQAAFNRIYMIGGGSFALAVVGIAMLLLPQRPRKMGWLRNLFGVPDDVWADAARKLGAEFVQGKWLANSEIKLSHRNHPITLEVRFGTGDDSTEYTRAVPGVALDPKTKLAMLPQVIGLLGSITSGLAARTGYPTIKIPALGEDYLVFGDDEKLANEIFGHRDFLSALKGLTQNPKILVGRTLSVDLLANEDEDNFHVSVRGVLKDIHQLVALVDLTKVLLDLLDQNGCLVATRS